MTRADITEDLDELVERVREAAGALIQGDVRRYFALVNEAPDHTLMPPTGGPTRHGPDSSPASVEALEEFSARSGEADLELDQSYVSLRVTLVFRREGSDWRLVHRHADAPVQPTAWNSCRVSHAAQPILAETTPQASDMLSAACARRTVRREGAAMPTVMAYHDVKDTDHWLASPKRAEFFGPLGITNVRTFVDPENRTRVGLLMDVPDMDAVMAAMETQAAADAMEHDGVLPETLVILVES